jgi:hypothetical protein
LEFYLSEAGFISGELFAGFGAVNVRVLPDGGGSDEEHKAALALEILADDEVTFHALSIQARGGIRLCL